MLTKNTAKLKQVVAEHIAADSVVQSIDYWDAETMRGCFIGCLAHSGNPRINEEIYGLPTVVQRIAENIFEVLPEDDAKAFFAALPDAVGCDGKNLSRVPWQFLAAELRSLPPQPDDIQSVIDPVIAGMDLLAQGLDWPAAEAGRVGRAAWAVEATWAAEATWDAEAIWAAVWAAEAIRAAARAADAAARLRQRDLLLRLIAEAPVELGESDITTPAGQEGAV